MLPVAIGGMVGLAGVASVFLVAGRRRRKPQPEGALQAEAAAIYAAPIAPAAPKRTKAVKAAEAAPAAETAPAEAAPPVAPPARMVRQPGVQRPLDPVKPAEPFEPVERPPVSMPAAATMSALAPDLAALEMAGDDTMIPRWRRPSLKAARAATGRTDAEFAGPRLEFRDAGTPGLERRRVRYRLVRLSDAPDEIRSVEVGQLEEKDQVEILETYASYFRVRTPLGQEGWVHRTTLGPAIVPGTPVEDQTNTTQEDELAPAAWANRTSSVDRR
jgi:hypothetical protein